jgi:hypothetical protein
MCGRIFGREGGGDKESEGTSEGMQQKSERGTSKRDLGHFWKLFFSITGSSVIGAAHRYRTGIQFMQNLFTV